MPEQPLILIVDDEPDFIEIFRTRLSAAGFKVETALNAEVGMGKAKTLKPDLMLLDVKMPGLTGPEALLQLKEDPASKNLGVVFLTNFGDPRTTAGDVESIENKFSKDVG